MSFSLVVGGECAPIDVRLHLERPPGLEFVRVSPPDLGVEVRTNEFVFRVECMEDNTTIQVDVVVRPTQVGTHVCQWRVTSTNTHRDGQGETVLVVGTDPRPVLSISRVETGGLQIRIRSEVDGAWWLEVSDDLRAWSGVTEVHLVNGVAEPVTVGITSQARYYRLRSE